MVYIYNKTHIGYLHTRSKKPCQDFSSSYKDNESIVITCSDGHGGDLYVRSNLGSKFACDALLKVFKNITRKELKKLDSNELANKIKLNLLVEWNGLVAKHLKSKPINSKEKDGLTEKQKHTLKTNPVKAYGATLAGALIIKDKLVVFSIGDTDVFGIRKGELIHLVEGSDEPVANITNSLCQEDVFSYIKVDVLNWKGFDGVLLCTDGLTGPHQSYEYFNDKFVKPLIRRVLLSKILAEVDSLIETIASKVGSGDDVSLSFVLKDKTNLKHY